jgi:hypothetical protein
MRINIDMALDTTERAPASCSFMKLLVYVFLIKGWLEPYKLEPEPHLFGDARAVL